MSTFALKIITREGEPLGRDVLSVDVPAAHGRLTVLAKHQPLVCSIRSGAVTVVDESGTREVWNVSAGVLQVQAEETALLVARAARA